MGVEQQKCVWSVIISTSTSVYRATTNPAAAAADSAASASHEPSARRTVQSCPPQTPSTMRPIPEELTTLIAGKTHVNSCVWLSVVLFYASLHKVKFHRERLVKRRKRRLNMDDSSFRLLSAAFPFMPSIKQYAGLTSKLLTVCVCMCVSVRARARVLLCLER